MCKWKRATKAEEGLRTEEWRRTIDDWGLSLWFEEWHSGRKMRRDRLWSNCNEEIPVIVHLTKEIGPAQCLRRSWVIIAMLVQCGPHDNLHWNQNWTSKTTLSKNFAQKQFVKNICLFWNIQLDCVSYELIRQIGIACWILSLPHYTDQQKKLYLLPYCLVQFPTLSLGHKVVNCLKSFVRLV